MWNQAQAIRNLIKDRTEENIQNKAHENTRMENKEEGRELEDAMEKSTLCVTGVLEGEKRIKQK